MIEHRYILEPYRGMNTRYRCPECQGRDKTFSLYIDRETSEHLHLKVGRCNRESKCGYHYTPKQYFHDNNISFETNRPLTVKPYPTIKAVKPASYIPVEVFTASLKAYENNHFVQFLSGIFGPEIANELIARYFIGTSKHWPGATVFWQVDAQGKIRTGKIMLYNSTTGKRIKEPYNHIQWVHKLINQPDFELRQCLYGEHLLKNNTKSVALVESEKSAIIASVYLPQFIWLATGSLTNLNTDKCQALKGRTVTLFPDLNGFDKWSRKAKELSVITKSTVSDLLERRATGAEREQGLDLADYLLRFDYWQFSSSENVPENTLPYQNKLHNGEPTETQRKNTVLEREVPGSTGKQFAAPDEARSKIQGCISASQNLKKPDILSEVLEPKNVTKLNIKTARQAENWTNEINELFDFFEAIDIPKGPIRLNRCTIIERPTQFIESHFQTIVTNAGNKRFRPYLERLQLLKNQLIS
jgi:hypothetical protein